MYQRTLNLSKNHSFFLFGSRGTGKTELLRSFFKQEDALFLDLLNFELANRLSAYPEDLLKLIMPEVEKKKWVVIDEIQKVPSLLDIVHQQISKKKFKFALTGSSARKLKRGGANLLAGRAFVYNLFPLTYKELGNDFNLHETLQFGSLPEAINLKDIGDKKKYLKSYAQTYLLEEVISEQVVRHLPPFRRFLDIVGQHTSEIISYTNIARDVLSDAKTIMRYFEILEDTLLGFFLPSFERSIRKQQKKSKKFYFFDNGVARTLAGRLDDTFHQKTFEYGQYFENFIVNEIHRCLTYRDQQFKLSFLRVSESQEIDLIVEKPDQEFFLCEIKSTNCVNENYVGNLELFAKDFKKCKLRLISNDPMKKQFGKVLALPWQEAINEICM